MAVTAIATLLLVVGVIVALLALRETRRVTQLPAVIDLLREYRSEPMRLARVSIHNLPPCDPEWGFEQLGRDREAVERVSHFLDNVGLLIAEKLLKPKPAAMFLGGSALGMWDVLAPYIDAERRVNNRPTYQRHFEHAAAIFKEIDIDAEIARLKSLLPPKTDQ